MPSHSISTNNHQPSTTTHYPYITAQKSKLGKIGKITSRTVPKDARNMKKLDGNDVTHQNGRPLDPVEMLKIGIEVLGRF